MLKTSTWSDKIMNCENILFSPQPTVLGIHTAHWQIQISVLPRPFEKPLHLTLGAHEYFEVKRKPQKPEWGISAAKP